MVQNASFRWRLAIYVVMLAIVAIPYAGRIGGRAALAQQDQPDDGGPSAGPQLVDPASLPPDPSSSSNAANQAGGAVGNTPQAKPLNALELLFDGGIFMIPICFLCFIGATYSIERFFGLRRGRVLPRKLVSGLGQMSSGKNAFDPRSAYRVCQQYPSAAANIIRAMLQLVGRPRGEIEGAVKEVSEREAERLYKNVRWLNLCASVTPLLGLLGTIQGMIIAFYDTTQLAPGQNKATVLAHGIYVALVTTFGGLVVAIPAATLSHYFEGRIQSLFHEIHELLFNLMPQLERFEGRVRFGKPGEGERDPSSSEPPPFKEPMAGSKN